MFETWLPSFRPWVPALLAAALASGLPNLAASVTTIPPIPLQYRTEAPGLEASWSAERSALGKRLFRERRLSRDGSVACIDCHVPQLAYADGRVQSVGVRGQLHSRNSPALVNGALGRSQGWDGRTTELEASVLRPIESPIVMDLPIGEAVHRLDADPAYRKAFQSAFGGRPTRGRLSVALAAYLRGIYSVDAPFDDFVAGDHTALDPSAMRGLALFAAKARCGECHSGARFTDDAFHTLGIGDDPGRSKITGLPADLGAFRTPSLREVALTAPYMHDGSLATLAEVVDYHDRGGNPHPGLDPRLKPLGLTAQEKADLVAFLEALSGTVVQDGVPVDPNAR
jgi:cytochrome c peroxidase